MNMLSIEKSINRFIHLFYSLSNTNANVQLFQEKQTMHFTHTIRTMEQIDNILTKSILLKIFAARFNLYAHTPVEYDKIYFPATWYKFTQISIKGYMFVRNFDHTIITFHGNIFICDTYCKFFNKYFGVKCPLYFISLAPDNRVSWKG